MSLCGKLQFVIVTQAFLSPLKTGVRKALAALVWDAQVPAFRKQVILELRND